MTERNLIYLQMMFECAKAETCRMRGTHCLSCLTANFAKIRNNLSKKLQISADAKPDIDEQNRLDVEFADVLQNNIGIRLIVTSYKTEGTDE